jgi:hypothetical protein
MQPFVHLRPESLTRLHNRRHSARTRVSLDRHAAKSWTDMVAKSWPAWREIPARHARNTQPWVQLPKGVPAMPEYYDRNLCWPPESLARRATLLPQIEAYRASLAARS